MVGRGVNAAIVEEGLGSHLGDLSDEHRRWYCHYLLDLTCGDPKRRIAYLNSKVRLDSDELGHDIVSRFATQQDPDLFDPDYQPVDFIFRVVDADGSKAIEDFRAAPDIANSERVEQALNAARLVVSFSLTPPNLA